MGIYKVIVYMVKINLLLTYWGEKKQLKNPTPFKSLCHHILKMNSFWHPCYCALCVIYPPMCM